MSIIRNPPEREVKTLLTAAGLPIDDITPEHLEHFTAVRTGECLEGVVGIELHDSVALLRSLAVVSPNRGSGLGGRLLAAAEQYAEEKGVHSIFLLTTTAESFFSKQGYSALSREAAPDAIRNTSEFAGICPASAVLMVKDLPSTTSRNLTRGADALLTG